MKVGDLVQTIKGWSYKTWTGVVLEFDSPGLTRLDTSGAEPITKEDWALVCWTEASQIDGQVFWQPVNKLEVISAGR